MQQQTLHLFVVAAGDAPASPPQPARELVIEGADSDDLVAAAHAAIAAEGLRVRCVSFGSRGLVGYAEAPS